MVKEKIVLDTNVVIDIFNNKQNALALLNNYQTIYLPITVCGELLFGAKNAANYSIKITYSDNVSIIADFKGLLEKGVMTLLKNPVVFDQVQIGSKGRSIIWQEQDIDFCADSLRSKFNQPQAV
jgi:predicted nucleic acid-binding protein